MLEHKANIFVPPNSVDKQLEQRTLAALSG
jgi:hypothetical protein